MQKASNIIQLLNKKTEKNSTSKARSLTPKTSKKETAKDFLVLQKVISCAYLFLQNIYLFKEAKKI